MKGKLIHILKHIRQSKTRSAVVIRHSLLSLLMKGASILSGLLIVPMTIRYVNPTQYGVWLTISSIITWISFFNLGLGNGMRNKFAEARAKGDDSLARKYVSTTYFALSMLVIPLFIIAQILNSIINWDEVLNLEHTYRNELKRVFAVLSLVTCLNMIAGVFKSFLYGCQKAGVCSVIETAGQYAALLVIYFLTKTTEGSLTNLAIYFSGVPLFVLIIATITLFCCSPYRKYFPSFKYIDLKLVRSLLSLGGQIFLIYLCIIFVMQIINVVITREFGATDVSRYNISSQYFNVLYMVVMVALSPVWSSVTEAFSKGELNWLKKLTARLEAGFVFIVFGAVLLLCLSTYIYELWIGKVIDIPWSVNLSVMLLILSKIFGNMYMHVINGIGFVRLQLYIYMLFALAAIPCFTALARTVGIEGVICFPAFVYVILGIASRIQLSKLYNNRATGVWCK